MGTMADSSRSERYFLFAVCLIAGAGWLSWLAFGLPHWPDRLYLVSLTAIVGTMAVMAYLWWRGGGLRAWLPGTIAGTGLLAQLLLTTSEGPLRVTIMADAGLAFAIAAWAAWLLIRRYPHWHPQSRN
jgi:hypothetical protein